MRGSDGLEDGAHVGERLLRLGLDPALDDLHRFGVEPDLARDVQGLVHHHGLQKWTSVTKCYTMITLAGSFRLTAGTVITMLS